MKTSILRLLLTLSSVAIIGCANPHSTPISNKEPQRVDGTTMNIWVDQDGTFYPADWKTDFFWPERLPSRSAASLGALAHDQKPEDDEKQRLRIAQAEKSVLTDYRDFISDKKRLFVLVHGYNNNEEQANVAYELIKKKIIFRKGDGVIEFYWDGLTAGGVRRLPIWFKATGNSQLVGMRGLRKLLNATQDKDIVFITHSRGASVFLSALSDPPYRSSFVSATERPSRGFKVYGEPKKLEKNNNEISALLLAPAIGAIDFQSPEKVGPVREFDKQLEEVYYSVNREDRILNKLIGISEYFNPTDLGVDADVAKRIDDADGRFKRNVWAKPMKTHGFPTYVENCQFVQMLKEMDIDAERCVESAHPE